MANYCEQISQKEREDIYNKFPRLFVTKPEISIGCGWVDLVTKLCEDIVNTIKDTSTKVIVIQVKEKFGTLRFYTKITSNDTATSLRMNNVTTGTKYNDTVQTVHDLISVAENESARLCEYCGTSEEVKTEEVRGYLIKTLCKVCKFLYWL